MKSCVPIRSSVELRRTKNGRSRGLVAPPGPCDRDDRRRCQRHARFERADLGIAMGSGSQVAKAVAQLVLLDDQFEALPVVVAEGRQVLHNIERVALLFLVKNVYSLIISVAVAVAGWSYPFASPINAY